MLVTSDEPIQGAIRYVTVTPARLLTAEEINNLAKTDEKVGVFEYKSFGSGKVNGQNVYDQYFYVIALPRGTDMLLYFKLGLADEANNMYTGPWSAFNADHKVYIW